MNLSPSNKSTHLYLNFIHLFIYLNAQWSLMRIELNMFVIAIEDRCENEFITFESNH